MAYSGTLSSMDCMELNHLWGNHHKLMQEVGGNYWSKAATILATHGLHMLLLLKLNVLVASTH